MPTVVNTTPATDNSNGFNNLLAVVLLIVFVFLFFYYGLPALRNLSTPTAPSVNVPGKVDVNIKRQ